MLVKVGSGSDALPMHDGYPRDILRLAVFLLGAGRVAPHDPPTSLSQELAKQPLLISITANLLQGDSMDLVPRGRSLDLLPVLPQGRKIPRSDTQATLARAGLLILVRGTCTATRSG